MCGEAVREGDGTVEASLTAALPYASLEASERLKLWGALGYGEGEVTLATAMGGRYRADTTWRMAAAGLRGDLLEAPTEGSGPALALTSDALWARTASEKTLDLSPRAHCPGTTTGRCVRRRQRRRAREHHGTVRRRAMPRARSVGMRNGQYETYTQRMGVALKLSVLDARVRTVRARPRGAAYAVDSAGGRGHITGRSSDGRCRGWRARWA